LFIFVLTIIVSAGCCILSITAVLSVSYIKDDDDDDDDDDDELIL